MQKFDQSRLLVATFIVATYITYLQLTIQDIPGSYRHIVTLLVAPLASSACFSFLFVMLRAVAMDTLVITSRMRWWLDIASRAVYFYAVFMYALVLTGVLCGLALLKGIAAITGKAAPFWPIELMALLMIGGALYIIVRGNTLATLKYYQARHRTFIAISLLYCAHRR